MQQIGLVLHYEMTLLSTYATILTLFQALWTLNKKPQKMGFQTRGSAYDFSYALSWNGWSCLK